MATTFATLTVSMSSLEFDYRSLPAAVKAVVLWRSGYSASCLSLGRLRVRFTAKAKISHLVPRHSSEADVELSFAPKWKKKKRKTSKMVLASKKKSSP